MAAEIETVTISAKSESRQMTRMSFAFSMSFMLGSFIMLTTSKHTQ
jgi:hypothetical protein